MFPRAQHKPGGVNFIFVTLFHLLIFSLGPLSMMGAA